MIGGMDHVGTGELGAGAPAAVAPLQGLDRDWESEEVCAGRGGERSAFGISDAAGRPGVSGRAGEEDDGLGPADEDEDEPGSPEEAGARDGSTALDEDVDETSAGGLRYPDDPPEVS